MTTKYATEIMKDAPPAPETGDWLTRAERLAVDSPEAYAAGEELYGDLRRLDREIESRFKKPKRKAWEAHREIVDWEKRERAPVQAAMRTVKRHLDGWDREMRRLAAAAEEEERKRREAEEARQLEEAAKLEDAGLQKAAEAVMERPVVPAPAFPIELTTPSTEGVARGSKPVVKILDATKFDPQWLLRVMADVPLKKLEESWLGIELRRLVKAHGSRLSKVVGEGAVEVTQETTRRIR